MEFSIKPDTPELRLYDMQQRIGQMAHNTPNVFNFYLPEYSAPGTPLGFQSLLTAANACLSNSNILFFHTGHIKAASLTSPEAQVMNGPTLTTFINGQFSLVEMGLNRCYGG